MYTRTSIYLLDILSIYFDVYSKPNSSTIANFNIKKRGRPMRINPLILFNTPVVRIDVNIRCEIPHCGGRLRACTILRCFPPVNNSLKVRPNKPSTLPTNQSRSCPSARIIDFRSKSRKPGSVFPIRAQCPQRPCKTGRLTVGQDTTESIQKIITGGIIEKNLSSINPLHNDMVQRSRCVYAGFSRHAIQISNV